MVAALAGIAIATLVRLTIDDQLPPGFPFLTYFPVVLLVAFTLGLRAGVFAALFGGLASWYWFLTPGSNFSLTHNSAIALTFYAFITGTEIALVHWMQRSNRLLVIEREANARLAQTRELLFRELQHRVSNNLQMVAALLTVQRRQIADESARSALDEAARRLQTIGRISRQLYDPAGGDQALGSFLDQLARDVIESSTTMTIKHEVISTSDARIGPEAAIPLALIVAESIANAIEHGFAPGQDDARLEIRLGQGLQRQRLAVEIEDNGVGLPDGFALDQSGSLGLRIATMLAGQIGGHYSLTPGTDRGAIARLELPLLAA
nr:histidine kinase dimerization/phosphoacceptor domain -containing protein [Sphingomonas kaistensis]